MWGSHAVTLQDTKTALSTTTWVTWRQNRIFIVYLRLCQSGGKYNKRSGVCKWKENLDFKDIWIVLKMEIKENRKRLKTQEHYENRRLQLYTLPPTQDISLEEFNDLALKRQKGLTVYFFYILCTYIRMYMHTYIHTYMHTYMYTYTYIHTHIHTYTHIYVHTYIHMHTYNTHVYVLSTCVHISCSVYMSFALYLYNIMYKCVCMYMCVVCMYVCRYVYMYVCMYVCIYVCIKVQFWWFLNGLQITVLVVLNVFIQY